MKKNSAYQEVFDISNVLFMMILGVIMFYPLWYVLCASFSSGRELTGYSGILFYPLKFNIASYTMMFKNPMIVRGYLNTFFIVTSGVIINIIFTAICAYVLSRKNIYWNRLFSKIIIFTMFFSGGLIPVYLFITKTLHMNDSFLALILPQAISVYNLIIMRTSFSAIPESLEESAKLDGAGHWTVLFKIIIPLSKAIIAVMILYYGVGHWNSWFDASIYIKERHKFPLQLILREILINNDTSLMSKDISVIDQESVGETIKYATIVVATIPILCVYPFLQKYFVKGVMIGAVKG